MKKVMSFLLAIFMIFSGFPGALAKTPQCEIDNKHSYDEYVYNNDATEYLDGTKTSVCVYGCGEKNTVTAIGTALNPNIIDLKLNERKAVAIKPKSGVIFKIKSEHNWVDGDEYWFELIFDSSVNSNIIANFYYDESYGMLDGGIAQLTSWGNYGAPVANEAGHIYYLSLFNTYDKDITYSIKLLLENECVHNYELRKQKLLPAKPKAMTFMFVPNVEIRIIVILFLQQVYVILRRGILLNLPVMMDTHSICASVGIVIMAIMFLLQDMI